MQVSNIETAYILESKVSCPRHPSKTIEYFCRHPECSDKLFCSACILKKQFCRHDQNQYIVDISQFLYQQKLAHEMKGLSTESDIHEYLVHLEDHNKLYRSTIDDEFNKFDKELEKLLSEVTNIINTLRQGVKTQFDQYVSSYNKIEETLQRKVNENFSLSYLSRYSTFDEIFKKNDCGSLIGLKELMDKLNKTSDQLKLKQIRQQFQNLISMHDQLPEVDYSKYETIKGYMRVFENKLSQAGVSLINLKNRVREIKSENSMPISAVKKIAHSTTFSSSHTRTIYAMGIIQSNLFIGADDGWIRIFNISNFQCLTSFQAHQSGIRALIVNGKNIITASYDKTIKIWNFSEPIKMIKQTNYSPQKTLLGHTSSVISLRMVNNTTLASGSADYNIKLWDLQKGLNTRSFSGHMNDVLCLASTINGATLISGSADRTVKIWSLQKKYSSACLKTLSGHTDFVWTIVLLPDDTTLFSGGLDKVIKMWDIFTGQLIRNLPTEHTSHITKLQIFSNNVILSSSNDGALKFWDYGNNSCVHTLNSKTMISTFILVDKNTILSAGHDKMIYVWD